jgi:hypothetical protein
MYSVKIPEGSSGAPKIKYRNQGDQCLLKCLASALHHLRHPAKALIISQGYTACDGRKEFNQTMNFIRETMTTEHGKIPLRRKIYKPEDPLSRTPNPVVASLKAVLIVDGRVQQTQIKHCVCFVGDYIFDSNRETALPLNPLSLDQICHDVVPGATYAGIYWSRELLLVRELK